MLMAKYATTEKLFKCYQCNTEATKLELERVDRKDGEFRMCPKCGYLILWRDKKTKGWMSVERLAVEYPPDNYEP